MKATKKRYDSESGIRVTDCCGTYSTYMGDTLCCKACCHEVSSGQGDGSEYRPFSKAEQKIFKDAGLYPKEIRIIARLRAESQFPEDYKITKASRRSDVEGDVDIDGVDSFQLEKQMFTVIENGTSTKVELGGSKNKTKFSSWLVLIAIKNLVNWPYLAKEFDYPQMVEAGDWSGVRDTNRTKLQAIFKNEFSFA